MKNALKPLKGTLIGLADSNLVFDLIRCSAYKTFKIWNVSREELWIDIMKYTLLKCTQICTILMTCLNIKIEFCDLTKEHYIFKFKRSSLMLLPGSVFHWNQNGAKIATKIATKIADNCNTNVKMCFIKKRLYFAKLSIINNLFLMQN